METITQLLNEIEKSLQQLDHSCLVHLNPGISSQQIQELFEKIPLQPTQDLRALYTWRNGCLGQVLVPNFCQWRGRFLCHELGSRSSGTNSWFLCI